MNLDSILVVLVDGLRASAVGAYGNTSFPTPALDEFAAESFLFDFCFAPAAELSDVYRALWRANHPLRPPSADDAARPLPQLLADRGYQTTLVTDESELIRFTSAASFQQVHLTQSAGATTIEELANDIAHTSIAQLFAATCDVIDAGFSSDSNEPSSAKPRLVWVHTRGMYGPWDAPLELQRSLLDEGDPPPIETTTPPDIVVSSSDEPDAAFRFSCAYAAQVMALDECWRGLMEAIDARPADERWCVMLMGARGFPLGEHRRVGGVDVRGYIEQLHVPWLIRLPDGEGRLARAHSLVSHTDILPTLLAHIDGDPVAAASGDGINLLPIIKSSEPVLRDALLTWGGAGCGSIRTLDWCLREGSAGADDALQPNESECVRELFVRPDDRWEANDVAKLCPETVDMLGEALSQAAHALAQNRPVAAELMPGLEGGSALQAGLAGNE